MNLIRQMFCPDDFGLHPENKNMRIDSVVSRLGGVKPALGNDLAPMTEDDLLGLEKHIEASLPEQYKNFLKKYGACAFNGESSNNPYIVFTPIERLPTHISTSGDGMLEVLYGGVINGRDSYSLLTRAKFYAGRIVDSLVSIGDDGGAGQLCLGLREEHREKIYFWDQKHEAPSEEEYLEDFGVSRPKEVLLQNIYLVAEDFGDFLSRLRFRAD